MALVHQIIDFVDDIDKSILKDAAKDAPAHIKTATILSAEEREKLQPAQFALVMRTKEAQVLKKFPLTDAANTWLSCQYFCKTAEQLPFVAQKIAATHLKRACALYGVQAPESVESLSANEILSNFYDEVKSLKEDKAYTAQVKTASAQAPDGSEHFYALGERYAMPSPEYVKKASAYFNDHYREFSDAGDRSEFAYHVRERAKELQVALEKKAEDSLKTYAGDSYGDILDTQMRLRQELLQAKPDLGTALSKLASHKPTTEPSTFSKALFLFDKKAGLTRYYDGYLSDAFKSTFGVSFRKTASGYQWEDEKSGYSINDRELEKTATDKYDKIKSYFGESVASELKKHAVAIFDSLPQDAKETIVKIARGVL